MSLSIKDFPGFFQAIHGYGPFPWQQILAERVCEAGAWPRGIDLPTASGKTACLDVAVFSLALSVDDDARTHLPRRVFFVVDRRIVVDAAHQRAEIIARELARATDGVMREVAERLRLMSDSEAPLTVSRQRGGAIRDDDWVLDPTQPAIITGTVDQIGSRLLFRGYGPGRLTQSIHAALVGSDSLILLDEAHCARPFLQTADRVRRYAGESWCQEQVARPLCFTVLSATLPEQVESDERFPRDDERAAALNHEILRTRAGASKPAALVVASKAPAKAKRGEHGVGSPVGLAHDDYLIQHAADLACKCAADEGRRRIAVMVNRVATAAAIHEQLLTETKRSQHSLEAEVVLLTGRMRPLDRDALVDRWSPTLRAGSILEPERPVILVTTQCLEVGADFDFDALITECASLDALRQRFGRLNRFGNFDSTSAAVLHRKRPGKKPEEDPIYGEAMDATWSWLDEHATIHEASAERATSKSFDFGIDAMEQVLPTDADERADLLKLLNAPSPDAPTLLPAHMDLLCQTAPRPEPDPEVALYLHGAGRGAPEARVLFRTDLPEDRHDQWLEAVALVPPTTPEMLAVPLHRLRRWLAGSDLGAAGDTGAGDVEGQREELDRDNGAGASMPFLLWRGRERSLPSIDPGDIRPGDIVVVPDDKRSADRLAHYFTPADPAAPLDVAEAARLSMGKPAVLRVTRGVLKHHSEFEAVNDLLRWAETELDRADDELDVRLEAVAQAGCGWLSEVADQLRRSTSKNRIEGHPLGGVVLIERRHAAHERGIFADEDDESSAAGHSVTLSRHANDVECEVRRLAKQLSPFLVEDIALAARLHDSGKSDERFQALLRNAPFLPDPNAEPLAKGERVAQTPGARRRLHRRLDLPHGFRHEFLSLALAEGCDALPSDGDRRDLVLHLIAAHHGYARPFAPVCIDEAPPDVEVAINGSSLSITAAGRRQTPAHRLDSGVAERFWRLTRRYGWWGLAYLEALLRLADWRASAREAEATQTPSPVKEPA